MSELMINDTVGLRHFSGNHMKPYSITGRIINIYSSGFYCNVVKWEDGTTSNESCDSIMLLSRGIKIKTQDKPNEQESINPTKPKKELILETPVDSEHSLTVTSIALHRKNESCIFGESTTVISLQDEAGGLFLELSQCNDSTENGKIKLGFEELPLVIQAVEYLKNQKAPRYEERLQKEQRIKYMKDLGGIINS